MKIYIKKLGKGFIVLKETTTQSVISDLFTILVLIVAIGLDIVFALVVAHSVVIDIFVVILIFTYFLRFAKNETQEVSKEEIIKQINDL